MRKKCIQVLNLDRGKISKKNINKTYLKSLRKSKSVKIENNSIIKDLGNGYCEIKILNSENTH